MKRYEMRRPAAVAAAVMALLLAAASWAAWRRHRALKLFEEGAAAYYSGDGPGAEAALRRSLSSRRDPRVASFLSGLLIERALVRLGSGDRPSAAEALREASRLSPRDPALAAAARSLVSPGWLSRTDALERLAVGGAPAGPLKPAASGLEARLEAVASTQAALERALRNALRLAALALAAFAAALAWLAWALFGPRGLVTRYLLESRAGRGLDGSERKLLTAEKEIHAIEAEFTLESDAPISKGLLKPFLEDSDPRVRARAASALARLSPDDSRRLIAELIAGSKEDRLAAVAALAKLPALLDLLEPALEEPDPEVQAAAVRALAVLKTRGALDAETRAKVDRLLVRVRERWIV